MSGTAGNLAVRGVQHVRFGTYIVISAAIVSTACTDHSRVGLDAVLWMQTAVEYRGSCVQSYRLAKRMLDQALIDEDWTAIPEQVGRSAGWTPAVILDVDETVLDNSPYNAWRVKGGRSWSRESWNAWCMEAKARLVPGAKTFLQYVQQRGVRLFFITNREYSLKQATLKNLDKLGVSASRETLLMRGEYDDGSAKKMRRAEVAKNHRILLLIGDNFGDFVDKYKRSCQERQEVMDLHASMWGRQWIVLPNPAYGSWEQALYSFEHGLSPDEQTARKMRSLDVWARSKDTTD